MMNRVLVTGGTGVLGRQLRPRLAAAGHTVRVMSRRRPAPGEAAEEEWVVADLRDQEGLDEAVAGVDAVVHAATAPFRRTHAVDVQGTKRLLEACRRARVAYLHYVSIVGIDSIPYRYFRFKVAAERAVMTSGVPWSVLRATQFHELLDWQIGLVARAPVLVFPADLRFQLLDSGEAADHVVDAVRSRAIGRLADIGGPIVQTSGEIVTQWLEARGERRRLFSPRIPGKMLDAYRAGWNCAPHNPAGSITWADWLARRYGVTSGETQAATVSAAG